jgi:molecular chaperone Hsp33
VDDYLIRIVTKSGAVRAIACLTTGLVRTICQRHDTWPTATVALGRALTGGALMGALLKGDQRVALKFEGNGPLRKILVEANATGAVCGSVGVHDVMLPPRNGREDVPGALGRAGFLTVTKDLGLKEPYQGVVQLVTSEIGDDLALYLTESEQVPSAVGLGVGIGPDGVTVAGGFLVQALPPQDEEVIDTLMERIGRLTSLTQLLQAGTTPEGLLKQLFAGIPFDVLERQALRFQCSCSRSKVERALLSLGREELTSLAAAEEGVSTACEFCKEAYHFTSADVQALLAELPEMPGQQ